MTPRRVLVVGGSGPIGRRIASQIRSSGGDPLALGRSSVPALDVRNRAEVRELFAREQIDVVHYLVNGGVADDERWVAEAVADFESLLSVAYDRGTPTVVLASSAAVYGTAASGALAETAELVGRSPYAREKIALEDALRDAAGAAGAVGVALRLFNVYGPGLRNSLINRVLLDDDMPHLLVSDRFVRDYIHVDDVACAFSYAAAETEAGFLAVNVGTGRGTTNAELADLAPPGSYVADRSPIDPTFSVADVAAARDRWGFAAEVTLEDAVRDPERWLRAG